MQFFGRHYATGHPVAVQVVDGRIAEIQPLAMEESQLETAPWISPGLLDVQVNGYGGREFSSDVLTEEEVQPIVDRLAQFGVTRCCPTVTTHSADVMKHALRTLAAVCRSSPSLARRMPGFHVEGPFLSPENGPRGAHPLAFIRPPDWDEFQQFQQAAEGRIRLLTLSPEYDDAEAFIRQVVASGVVVAIGHTAAAPEQIRAAVDAGATMSTHLGNGSHAMLHRLRNYLWEQLAEDRLTASLIADGHHLPPAVVKSLVRGKTPPRCVLVSDFSGQAGQPPGRYASPFCDVEILPDGKLVVAGQRELLAGATLPLNVCLANTMAFAGTDLPTVIRMAVHTPAKVLGFELDELAPGSAANMIQFQLHPTADGSPLEMQIGATVFDGEVIYGTPWTP